MRTRPRWLLLGSGALLVLALFLFPMWWPMIVGDQPEIVFPGVSGPEHTMLETLQAIDPTRAALTYISGTPTFVPEEAQATPDISLPIMVSRGDFIEIDALHWAHGEAVLFRDAEDNTYILRFNNFEVRNGPGLEVLLSMNPDPRTKSEVHQGAGAITLGTLIGSVGAQNYPVQNDVDLTLYHSVVLYSRDIDAVFSVASLVPVE